MRAKDLVLFGVEELLVLGDEVIKFVAGCSTVRTERHAYPSYFIIKI
jgi:hypothetical protein